MADDKRVALRQALRDAIKYREILKEFTNHSDSIKELGLSNDPDPHRKPGTPTHRGVEVQAVLEDANESAQAAARALLSELSRLGYPTLERGFLPSDPSGRDTLHSLIQSEADSTRRRIRFTANKDDVKVFEPKGK